MTRPPIQGDAGQQPYRTSGDVYITMNPRGLRGTLSGTKQKSSVRRSQTPTRPTSLDGRSLDTDGFLKTQITPLNRGEERRGRAGRKPRPPAVPNCVVTEMKCDVRRFTMRRNLSIMDRDCD
ncbi:unnamed protein product [Lota lota]